MVAGSFLDVSFLVLDDFSSVLPVALVSVVVRTHVCDPVFEGLHTQKVIRYVKLFHQLPEVFPVFLLKLDLLLSPVDLGLGLEELHLIVVMLLNHVFDVSKLVVELQGLFVDFRVQILELVVDTLAAELLIQLLTDFEFS